MQKSVKISRRIALVLFLGITVTVAAALPTTPNRSGRIRMRIHSNVGLINYHLAVPSLHAGLFATSIGSQIIVLIDATTNGVTLSTVAIGYLLSFIAALKTQAVRSSYWYACFILSALGLLGFLNEAVRLATHHDQRFLVSLPPLLALFDWLHTRQCEARDQIPLLTPIR
jgi:hypothetical protein